MKAKLLHQMSMDLRNTSIPKLAKEIGLQYETLYRLIKGDRGGRLDTWEVIMKHYNKKAKASRRS